METACICTPTRPTQSQSSPRHGKFSLLESRLSLGSPAQSGGCRTITTTANLLTDFDRDRGIPSKKIRKRNLSSALSSGPHRQLSQSAQEWIRQRNVSMDSAFTSDTNAVSKAANKAELGDAGMPILHFRPQLWKHIDRTRLTLNLDLFWPMRLDELVEQDEEDHGEIRDEIQSDNTTFPLRGLLPLCEFRNLRFLRLGGLMQSYQTHIWRTCWLNPGLVELILEMALEPVMNESSVPWTPINRTWCRKKSSEAFRGYL